MTAITDAHDARTALQSVLAADLAGEPHATTFAAYGGVDVILEDDEPDEPDQVGKPYVAIGEPTEADSEWGWWFRDVSIPVRVMATDFSGAQTGAANPVGSDTLLSKAITAIVRDRYTTLRDDYHMYATKLRKGGGANGQGEARTAHENRHDFTCVIDVI
jgi:hypothetical protein